MYTLGAILLHRKLIDWQWYHDVNVKTVFLHLLLSVNWKNRAWKKIIIERGQKLTSYAKLSEQTGLTVKQVRGAIEKLRTTGEIKTARAANGLLVSIVNFERYQPDLRAESFSEGLQETGKGLLINNTKTNNNNIIKSIPQKLRSLFESGGWSVPENAVLDWIKNYKVEWIVEAFKRSVKNCGSNPPFNYVRTVLENIAAKEGERNENRSGKKLQRLTEQNNRKKGKYYLHPAGSGAEE